MTRPVPVLGSFWYFRRANLAREFAACSAPVDFLADSGAFTALKGGARITVESYADWLCANARYINAAATLDVVGDWRGTAVNTEKLAALVDGRVPIMAAFHVGSPWSEFRRLCREYAYIGLGGAVWVGRRQDAMLRWCVRAHQIAAEHGARLHGFGLTRPPYPEKLPWLSVDSSYWTSAGRTGTLSLWDGRRFARFRVGTRSAYAHTRVIASYGGDPAVVSAPGFGIVAKVGPRGSKDREWMCTACATSFRRYERHIRSRRDPVAPPPGSSGEGLKIYQAASSPSAMRFLVDVIAADDATSEAA